jgi:hypothetical protein
MVLVFVYRHCKLKVDRAKLMEMSRIQKSPCLKLASTFEKYAAELDPSPILSSCIVEEDEYKSSSLVKKMENIKKGRYYCCYSMT